jgi:hypothetical protein
VQPFTQEHTEALLKAALRAARKSSHPRRDEATILLLLDTGLRASEMEEALKSKLGFKPSKSEVTSWTNSLRELARSVNAAKIKQTGIIVEYRLHC